MVNESKEKDVSKREVTLMDRLKLVGTFAAAFAVFIPLMSGIFQYRQSIQEDMDKNFRSVVEKLYSGDVEKRLAASSNIGTFIKKGIFKKGKYYNEARDLLINRLSIELDYNVLNAIRGSLEKVGVEEYKDVIKKLLTIERNIFIQKYALGNWTTQTKEAFEESEKRYEERERETLLEEYGLEIDKAMLNNLKEEMNIKWKNYKGREMEYEELTMHKQVAADFISIFLGVTKYSPIKELEFFRNSLDGIVLANINLTNATFKHSALSLSTLLETKFNRSKIIDTIFTYSDLAKSHFTDSKIELSLFDLAVLRYVDFSGTEFRDVFFAGSDLTGANFKAAKGLKPVYFYEAENIDKALFDVEFKEELDKKLKNITEDKFKKYINEKSGLSKQRIEELFKTIYEIKSSEKTKPPEGNQDVQVQ